MLAPYRERVHLEAPEDVRKAAVMMLLQQAEDQIVTYLIRRVQHQQDKHSGQVSFPGGKMDEEDCGLVDCALREVTEEVGYPGTDIKVLGQMTDVYIPVSGFLVSPFVGLATRDVELTPEPTEVASIIRVDTAQFYLPNAIKYGVVSLSNGMSLNQVPHFVLGGHVVWGATAMILSEYIEMSRGLR